MLGQPLGLPGFDEKILALYAKGMTARNIQEIFRELYGVEVSPTLPAFSEYVHVSLGILLMGAFRVERKRRYYPMVQTLPWTRHHKPDA